MLFKLKSVLYPPDAMFRDTETGKDKYLDSFWLLPMNTVLYILFIFFFYQGSESEDIWVF